MTCRVPGTSAGDCLAYHWLPNLGGHRERAGGRAPCPLCASPRVLSIQLVTGRVLWNLPPGHSCDRAEVGRAIAARVQCYQPRRARRPLPDLDEIRALVADRAVTVNALRLGVLVALGDPVDAAARELKLPRRTRYDAVRILAQNRRSRGVRILAQDERSNSAKSRTKPQVTDPTSDLEAP